MDARAELLGAPLRTLLEGQHGGSLPAVYEGVRISAPGARLQAFKRAECGRGWIVRIVETTGAGCRAHVELPVLGVKFDAELPPMAIRTYQIEDGCVQLSDFVEFD